MPKKNADLLKRAFDQKASILDYELLREAFDAFDLDKSGTIDYDEIEAMIESLGVTLSPTELYDILKAADSDDSEQIDFEEFKALVENHVKKSVEDPDSPGSAFAAILLRRSVTGPPMQWRADKLGPGLSRDVDDPAVVFRKAGGGQPEILDGLAGGDWGVQLLDTWLSTSQYGIASVLLEVESSSAGFMVGVVGSNYNPTEWSTPLDQEKRAAGVRALDGHVFVKGVHKPTAKLCRMPMSKRARKCRISIEINMVQLEMRITCVPEGADGAGASDGDAGAEGPSVLMEEIPVEVAVAVALGPSDKEQRVRVIGSSCERVSRADRSGKQKDEVVRLEEPSKKQSDPLSRAEAAVASTLSQ